MNAKVRQFIAAALATGIGVGAGVWWVFGEEERYGLLEEMVQARVSVAEELLNDACYCYAERAGEDAIPDQCSWGEDEERQIRRSTECLIDGARKLDEPVPEGLSSMHECLNDEYDAVRRCISEARKEHEVCDIDHLMARSDCQRQWLTIDCYDEVDDDTRDWLQNLEETIEGMDCAQRDDSPSIFDALPDGDDSAMQTPPIEPPLVSIDQDAIVVGEESVIELERGFLDDQRLDVLQDPEHSFVEAVEEFSDNDLYDHAIYTEPLVPLNTFVENVTATETMTDVSLLWRPGQFDESSHNDDLDDFAPDDSPRAGAGDADWEDWEIIVTKTARRFGGHFKRELWRAGLPPMVTSWSTSDVREDQWID